MKSPSRFSKSLASALMRHPSEGTRVPHHGMSGDAKMLTAYPTTSRSTMNKQRSPDKAAPGARGAKHPGGSGSGKHRYPRP